MVNRKKSVVVAALIGSSASVLAELPDPSILSRYGMTSDQLPAPQTAEPVEVPVLQPHFKLTPEEPWALLTPSKPSTTGNISIDRSAQQEHERCLRLQGEALQRRHEWGGCAQADPGAGIGTGFTR